MNKRIFFISLIFFLVACGIAGFYFWRNPSQLPGKTTTTDTTSPFGNPAGDRTVGNIASTTVTAPKNTVSVGELTNISTEPVAGAQFLPHTYTVRYTERATGHILDVNLQTGDVSRVSNTTISKIYNSIWSANGSSTAMQSLDQAGTTITTYVATINKTGTSTDTGYKMTGGTFPENIEQIAFSPSSKSVFYLQSSGFGSKGYKTTPTNSKPTETFSSPLNEWLVEWPEENTITLTAKPSASVAGAVYKINLKNNSFTRILGGINGLVTKASPDMLNIAYTDNTGELFIHNTKSGTATSTKLRTIADKCTWSDRYSYILYCAVPSTIASGQIPNSWYIGSVSYSDNIYQIDIQTGENNLVGSLTKKLKSNFDVMNPQLSPDESYLVFTNKKDLTLWTLQINEEH